jgi:hypothetical protein
VLIALISNCKLSPDKEVNTPPTLIEIPTPEKVVTIEPFVKDTVNYLTEIADYKKTMHLAIVANEKSIRTLKSKIKNQNKNDKALYQMKVGALELKNTDIKCQLDEYKEEGKEKWEIFKTDMTERMEELDKSFKKLQ